MGRVFLVGVGWIWARSAGKKKNCTIPALYPRAFSLFSFKSGVTFLSLGMALVMFILLSVWGAIFSDSHINTTWTTFLVNVISMGVLSGNAHIVANSPIFFWDVIGSEWVIAIEF